MFLLFHLLTGILLGYLLADRLGTRAVVLPCMFGALLPDLVDKPLALFVFGGTVGGRTFLHTLLFLSVLLLAGALVYRRLGRPALLAVGLGVASHQALDAMWTQPRAWFYPLFGPALPIEAEGWILRSLLLELADPLEWVSGAALVLLLLPVLAPSMTSAFAARHGRLLRILALGAGLPIAVLGLLLVGGGALWHLSGLTGWRVEAAWNTMLTGAVFLLAAYAAYRLSVRAGDAAETVGGSPPPPRFSDAPPLPGPRD